VGRYFENGNYLGNWFHHNVFKDMNFNSYNKMSDEIKINKNTVWKVATVFFAVALIVVILFVYKGKSSINNPVNLKGFLSDTSLYPSVGPENAEHIVVEFSDFQCPYCALASGKPEFAQQYTSQYADLIGVSEKIKDLADKGEIRFVYVSMSFLGQESVYAAQASLCANKQGKFFEMHDAIFAAHDGDENNGKYSKENLKLLAKNINGLDTSKFNKCLDGDETLSDVWKVSAAASTVVSETPTFYVDGQKFSASWNSISTALA
jgi:protein-disulfide isomerase